VNALLEMGGDESLDLTGTPCIDSESPLEEDVIRSSEEIVTNDDPEKESSSFQPPNWLQYFNKAYDCMSMRQASEPILKKGISLALTLQKVFFLSSLL